MGLATFKYQTNRGSIFFVVADDNPEWATALGTAPTGAVTESLTLKTSRNNREFGGTARLSVWHRQPAAANQNSPFAQTCITPEPISTKYVPVLKPDHTIATGTTVTVNGVTWKYSGRIVNEEFR